MKHLSKGYIDLITYQISIGALSVKFDSRIRFDCDPDPLGDGEAGLSLSDDEDSDVDDLEENGDNVVEDDDILDVDDSFDVDQPQLNPTAKPTPLPPTRKTIQIENQKRNKNR